MERLFGRKTKKSSTTSASPATTSPGNPAVVAEDEGFSVVSGSSNQPVYPNITNPYAPNVPQTAQSITEQNGLPQKGGKNAPGSASAYLDGVPFVLSTKCSGTDLDALVARVEGISERVKNVDWAATEYNFNLEKSVVSQDLATTLSRMNARN